MINNVHFSPSFQKRLIATTSLKEADKKVPCQIYELNSPLDSLYINTQLNHKDWQNSYFLELVYKDFAENKFYYYPHINFYTLEKENGDCLAYLEEIKHKDNRNISFIETVPTMANKNPDRKIKGIGETMIAFLAKYAQRSKNAEEIWIDHPTDSAKWFYKKLGFEHKNKQNTSMYLPVEKIDALVKKNEERNGSKIEFVG